MSRSCTDLLTHVIAVYRHVGTGTRTLPPLRLDSNRGSSKSLGAHVAQHADMSLSSECSLVNALSSN